VVQHSRSPHSTLSLVWLLLTLVILAASRSAVAVEPNEMLPDPAFEARARTVGR